MKASDFVLQKKTLLTEHIELLSKIDDEMANVWETTDNPKLLIDIIKALENENYTPAVLDYFSEGIQNLSEFCSSMTYDTLINQAIDIIATFVEGNYDLKADSVLLSKEIRLTLQSNDGSDKEKLAAHAASLSINWLAAGSPIKAAYHLTDYLVQALNVDKFELSNKIRMYFGNPFS